MFRPSKKSFLRGGLYHLSLISVTALAFNWGFFHLTGVDIASRVFTGTQVPMNAVALAMCAAAGMVLWNNWVD